MSHIVLIGGPRSGKSNYLFRAWIAIERELGRIVKDGLPEDLEYLNVGATYLLEGKFAPHTPRGEATTSRIPFAFRDRPQSRGELVVPDVSGEKWVDVYEKRQWPVAWDQLLSKDVGFLLFVQAGSPYEVPSLDWVTCERLHNDPTKAKPQADVPTQVLLVDWLQIIRHELDRQVGASYFPRVSVIVSAWDRVRGEEAQSPTAYLSIRFPMFADFLESRAHRLDIRVYGASVTAGEIDKDERYRDTYVAGDPAKAGFAVGEPTLGRIRREDVLLPIYWATGEAQ